MAVAVVGVPTDRNQIFIDVYFRSVGTPTTGALVNFGLAFAINNK